MISEAEPLQGQHGLHRLQRIGFGCFLCSNLIPIPSSLSCQMTRVAERNSTYAFVMKSANGHWKQRQDAPGFLDASTRLIIAIIVQDWLYWMPGIPAFLQDRVLNYDRRVSCYDFATAWYLLNTLRFRTWIEDTGSEISGRRENESCEYRTGEGSKWCPHNTFFILRIISDPRQSPWWVSIIYILSIGMLK